MSLGNRRLAGCELEECAKRSAKHEADSTYDEGGYDWQHCETAGCHVFFWRGRDGDDCVACGLRACGTCERAAGCEEGGWYCTGCRPPP